MRNSNEQGQCAEKQVGRVILCQQLLAPNRICRIAMTIRIVGENRRAGSYLVSRPAGCKQDMPNNNDHSQCGEKHAGRDIPCQQAQWLQTGICQTLMITHNADQGHTLSARMVAANRICQTVTITHNVEKNGQAGSCLVSRRGCCKQDCSNPVINWQEDERAERSHDQVHQR